MRSLLIYLTLYYYFSNWKVGSQTTDRVPKSLDFTCDNGGDIDFIDVCDGVSDCEDGSDERCENQAILFICTLEDRVEFSSSRYDSNQCQLNYRNFKRDYPNYSLDHFFNLYGCNSDMSRREDLYLTGIFLNNNEEFLLDLMHNSKSILRYNSNNDYSQTFEIQGISFNGPKINIFYSESPVNFNRNFRKLVVTRHNASSNDAAHTGNPSMKNPVTDELTSNMYYIYNSQIKVCDQNLVMCVNLQTKFIKAPVFLVISAESRLLFWIDRKSSRQYYLFRYSLNKSSKPTLIRKDLISPQWLAIDSIQDRVYWSDNRNDGSKLYSSTFDGTDLEIVSPGGSISFNPSSFAVFGDSVYWPDRTQKNIMKCSVHDCNAPTILKNFPADSDHLSIEYLIVDHRSGTPNNKIIDPCIQSSCSHMCLAASETSYNCYCEGSDKPLQSNDMGNGYCPDNTLIAAHQNSLYIVGLLNDHVGTPIIHSKKINISDISTIIYNSIDGSVILTEMEKQRIYTWKPITEELELILDDGLGTIDSIELDNYANNLYWIDPKIHTLKVMNMYSRMSVNILKGNSSYLPIKFALVPSKGFMVVLFQKESSIAVIERISMDGGPSSRKILLIDDEINKVENLTLYYLKEIHLICLLDGQIDEIKFFSTEFELQSMTNSNDFMNGIESITSLRNYIIWSEDDFTIHRAKVDIITRSSMEPAQSYIRTAQKISLGVERKNFDLIAPGKNFLKITSVSKQSVEPRTAKCLRNNGGCEKLCLSSSSFIKFTCLCPEGETLVNNKTCRKVSWLDTVTTAIPKESSSNETETNSELQISNPVIEITTSRHLKEPTESASVKSCPVCQNHPQPSPVCQSPQPCPVCQSPQPCPIFQSPQPCATESASVKSYPTYQNLQPQKALSLEHKLQEPSSSSSVIIMYAVFINILAVALGVGIGYYISRRKLLPENRRMRLFSNSGTLELSRVEPENESTSTTTLNRNS